MRKVNYKDEKVGDWAIENFVVDSKGVRTHNLFEALRGSNRVIQEGRYTKLVYKKAVVMSDTPAELQDHAEFLRRASSAKKILVNGLGIGMVLRYLLPIETIEKIVVVEKNKEVIKLTSKYFKSDKLQIVHADALDYEPTEHFDVVWHDIWTYIETANLPAMTALKKKYKDFCDWQGCWCENEALQMFFSGKAKKEREAK